MEIKINGPIIASEDQWVYDWFGIDAASPVTVEKGIRAANGQPLDVYINSGGGDVFAGSQIYEMLRTYTGRVLIHVQSIAASAASVILCARESEIAPTGMVMVHNVAGYANGDYREMEHASEILQKANQTIAAAYMEKTGMTEKEALELMDHETYLTAQEAVEKGLVDRISERSAQISERNAQNMQLVASDRYGMLPREVILKAKRLKNLEETKRMEIKMKLLKSGGIRK